MPVVARHSARMMPLRMMAVARRPDRILLLRMMAVSRRPDRSSARAFALDSVHSSVVAEPIEQQVVERCAEPIAN